MTYVVTEACIRCKYTDCVDICPVECFHEGPNMLVIHPSVCIDCGLCVPECPVQAIYPDTAPHMERWVALNQTYGEKWPVITQKKEAPSDADEWAKIKSKMDEFVEE